MFNCSPVWKYLLSGLGWAAAPAGGGLFVLLSPTRQDGISRLDIDIYTGPHQRGVFRLGKLGNMMNWWYHCIYWNIQISMAGQVVDMRLLWDSSSILLGLGTDGLLVSGAVMETDGVPCMMEAGMVTGLTPDCTTQPPSLSTLLVIQRKEARTIRNMNIILCSKPLKP